MSFTKLIDENVKLVSDFGAKPISELSELPDFYPFKKGLVYSHRNFDKFYEALKSGQKCAIVSGFNASGTMHLGHKGVFDINLFFQKKYKVPVFIPISDDESYVSGKVDSQESALKNSVRLAREILAYGFDSKRTYITIDQVYTNIYNLAIKLSKKITLSEIRSTYGYPMEENPGLFFYPAVQSAHVLFPIENFGFDYVLVPIGPDEDSHLRICRDVASRFGYEKPSVIHATFMPGIDGEKMSKSRNNTINFTDNEKIIRKKVNKAFSGGAVSVEEHRKHGGYPTRDIACFYLDKYFLDDEQSKDLFAQYKKGTVLSGDVKKMLADKLVNMINSFQENYGRIKQKDFYRCVLRNKESEGFREAVEEVFSTS